MLLHSVCCDTLFWLKYMKKILPPTDMYFEKGDLIEPRKGCRLSLGILGPHFENYLVRLVGREQRETGILSRFHLIRIHQRNNEEE